MKPTSFEGQYKSPRIISYNNEKTKSVKELLKDTNLKRSDRERHRQLELKATILQARIRHKFKHKIKIQNAENVFRNNFNILCNTDNMNSDVISTIIKCGNDLCKFYKPANVFDQSLKQFIELIKSKNLFEYIQNGYGHLNYYDCCTLALLVRLAARYLSQLSPNNSANNDYFYLIRFIESTFNIISKISLPDLSGNDKRANIFWLILIMKSYFIDTMKFLDKCQFITTSHDPLPHKTVYFLDVFHSPLRFNTHNTNIIHKYLYQIYSSHSVITNKYLLTRLNETLLAVLDVGRVVDLLYKHEYPFYSVQLLYLLLYISGIDHDKRDESFVSSYKLVMLVYNSCKKLLNEGLLYLSNEFDVGNERNMANDDNYKGYEKMENDDGGGMVGGEEDDVIDNSDRDEEEDDDSEGLEEDGSDVEMNMTKLGNAKEARMRKMSGLEEEIAKLLRYDFCMRTIPNSIKIDSYVEGGDESCDEMLIEAIGYMYHIVVLDCKILSNNDAKNFVIHLIQTNKNISKYLWRSCLIQKNSETGSSGSNKTILQQVIDGQIIISNINNPQQHSRNLELFFGKLLCFANCLYWRLLSVQDLDLIKVDETNSEQVIEFSSDELCDIVLRLRDIMYGLVMLVHPTTVAAGAAGAGMSSNHKSFIFRTKLIKTFIQLQRVVLRLYNRDVRKGLRTNGQRLNWVKPNLFRISMNTVLNLRDRIFRTSRRFGDEKYPGLSVIDIRQLVALKEMPFVVLFDTRISVLKTLIHWMNREALQQGMVRQHQHHVSPVRIRRNHIYEDSFNQITLNNYPNIWSQLKIEFIDSFGMIEAGIDGGGLLKEFLISVLKECCDPKRGLFVTTTNNLLYPNPEVDVIYPDNWKNHYVFIGRMLALGIVKDMLMESIHFAPFFIQQLFSNNHNKRGDVICELDIDNLQYLDEELYRNLLSLKSMSGNVEEILHLDFTLSRERYGSLSQVDLKPNGSNIPVTNLNRIEYIYLVADYKLNKQIQKQTNYIRIGIDNVVAIGCFQLFDSEELSVIITGNGQNDIDIDDLRSNTVYHGEDQFDNSQQVLVDFWDIVTNMTTDEKRRFIQFVTSISRAPLLGFGELNPKFGIQLTSDTDRLPSASTCINLLKLPCYNSKELMRHKLMTAITSQTGFHLS